MNAAAYLDMVARGLTVQAETTRLCGEASAHMSASKCLVQASRALRQDRANTRADDAIQGAYEASHQFRAEVIGASVIDEFGRRSRYEAIARGLVCLRSNDQAGLRHWHVVYQAILRVQARAWDAARRREKIRHRSGQA